MPYSDVEESEPWCAVLHGESVSGTSFTLFDCPLWNARQHYAVQGRGLSMEWRPQTVVVGGHFDHPDELTSDYLHLEMHGLLEWLTGRWDGLPFYSVVPRWGSPRRPRSMRRRSRAARARRRESRVRRIHNVQRARELWLDSQYREPDAVWFQVGDATINLGVSKHHRADSLGESTQSHASVSIAVKSPITVAEWRKEWIAPLQNMLIFLTAQPVSTALMKFDHPDEPRRYHRFEILERQWPPSTEPQGRGYDFMPVSRHAIGRHVPRLVRDWYALNARLEPANAVLFGTLVGRQWIENQLLNLTSFAEAYHERLHDWHRVDVSEFRRERRRILKSLDGEMKELFASKLSHAERLSQRDRLTELFDRAQGTIPELEQFEDTLVPQLIATRNHLTHWGEVTSNVLEDDALARGVQRLVAVLQANLLLDLDGDPDAVHYALAMHYWKSPVLFPEYEIERE